MGQKHLAMQNYVAEVLDLATGQPVLAGTPGELVLTSLLSGIRPLIRYRTGDVVALRPGDCACGNKADVLENFGRAADAVFLNGRRWFAKEIEHMVVGALGLTHGFRLSVTKRDARDVLLIELESPFAGVLQVAEAVLSEQIGGAVRCVQRSVPDRSPVPPRRVSSTISCIEDRR
jgi:phenylacetate-CoA ligase